jgi:hypothetical protein
MKCKQCFQKLEDFSFSYCPFEYKNNRTEIVKYALSRQMAGV